MMIKPGCKLIDVQQSVDNQKITTKQSHGVMETIERPLEGASSSLHFHCVVFLVRYQFIKQKLVST